MKFNKHGIINWKCFLKELKAIKSLRDIIETPVNSPFGERTIKVDGIALENPIFTVIGSFKLQNSFQTSEQNIALRFLQKENVSKKLLSVC